MPDNPLFSKALHAMIFAGDVVGVKNLLTMGVDVKQEDESGRTYLHYVKSPEIIDLLLAAGADINAQNPAGYTPLLSAFNKRAMSVATALIERGAKLNLVNNIGNTALHYAVYQQEKDIALTLLEKGIDTEIRNMRGQTALEAAIDLKYIGFSSLIEEFLINKEKERQELEQQALEKQAADKLATQERLTENLRKLDALSGSRRKRPNSGGVKNGG